MLNTNQTGTHIEKCSYETVLIAVGSVGCIGYLCLIATIVFWRVHIKRNRIPYQQKSISTIDVDDKRYVKDPTTAHQATEKQTDKNYDYAYSDSVSTVDYVNTRKLTSADSNRISSAESLYEYPENIRELEKPCNRQQSNQNQSKSTTVSGILKTDKRQYAINKNKNPKTTFHVDHEQAGSGRNMKKKTAKKTASRDDNINNDGSATTTQVKQGLDNENVTLRPQVYENVDLKHDARKSASSTDTTTSTDSSNSEIHDGAISMRGDINVVNIINKKTVYYPNSGRH